MAEESQAAASQATEETEQSGDRPKDEPTPPEGQENAPLGEAGTKALEAFKARARQAEKDAKALRERVKEFEDRDKSEQEKLEERATVAEKKAEEAERNLLRLRVASAKSLPAELADRLQGEDQKELEADADRLLELVKPKGSGDVDAGKGEVSTGNTFNELLRSGR